MIHIKVSSLLNADFLEMGLRMCIASIQFPNLEALVIFSLAFLYHISHLP